MDTGCCLTRNFSLDDDTNLRNAHCAKPFDKTWSKEMKKDTAAVTAQFNKGPMPKGHKTVMAGKPIVRRGKKVKK